VSTDQPTTPRERKPRTSENSLAGIRVASDEEIRAAARAEVARIRAEIAQQKLKDGAATPATKPAKKETTSSEVPLRRKTAVPPPASKAPINKQTSAAKPVISSAPSLETSTEPQSEKVSSAAASAEPPPLQNLRFRLENVFPHVRNQLLISTSSVGSPAPKSWNYCVPAKFDVYELQ